MDQYQAAYAKLNDAQKQAVDTIDGPVLVIAGPGTGKTQLLSMRVGSILRKDSTVLPGNILCLTFTDAAAANLRQRLIEHVGLGQDAYQVAIHTFNSFGSWIMSTYPEYFFQWREAATADELTNYRLIESILLELPGNHPLAGQSHDGTFFAIKQIQNFISDCKRANLTPDEVKKLLNANRKTYSILEPIINEYWPPVMRGSQALDKIDACIAEIQSAAINSQPVAGLTGIYTLITQELEAAQAEAADLPPAGKTKPFTAWKNKWLELDKDKKWIFTAGKHHDRLIAASDIYEKYQRSLSEQGLVDFNDQIMTVLAALKDHPELRLNLQERFLYVMIDEYQDTNRAQLQMAQYLTDAEVNEGRPNILVVGDDDQAIYRFQGADMSNVAAFEAAYRQPSIIPLLDNYRSNDDVIRHARLISTQIKLSLEKQKSISKDLFINVKKTGQGTKLYEFAHETEHYSWIAAEIKRLTKAAGSKSPNIAVLARQRDQLDALVPYLRDQSVAIDYERRENILDQEYIVALMTLARLVMLLSEQRLEEANALLPEVLSHPMWGIQPVDIWKIAATAHANKRLWLDVIFEQEQMAVRAVADFLIAISQQASHTPLEHMLDALIGQIETSAPDTELQDYADEQPVQLPVKFISPFKRYYFGDDLFDKRPASYLTLLSHLSRLRQYVRNYQQATPVTLHLKDLISFVDTYQRTGMTITDSAAYREDNGAVRLMTAHKAKGLEFDNVFVIGLENTIWSHSGGSNSRFSYPRNLAEIRPGENDADDALRLLFVAMTRARQTLNLCYFKESENGKDQQPFAPLLALDIEPETPAVPADLGALVGQYEQRWLSRHVGIEQADKHALLSDKLQRYQLSATHLNNFLDTTRGGPVFFLTQNLLNFPSSMNPSASYGIAIHETLRQGHEQVIQGHKLDVEQLLTVFRARLARQTMSEHDQAQYLHKGEENLRKYFTQEAGHFSPQQRVEVDFSGQGVVVDGVRLKGLLDLMDFDESTKSVIVSDYKTGKGYGKWELPHSSEEYERVKLHHYKHQLLFYKLLVDGSSTWGANGWRASSGVLRFVEPNNYGKIQTLELTYDADDLQQLQKLLSAVWRKIMALDFPDVSNLYPPSLSGILQFENDLINGKI